MSYICLPMQGAVISNDLEYRNMHIIRGTYDEKKEKLERILGWNSDESVFRMEHIVNTTNRDFFNRPLFIYKDNEPMMIESWLKYVFKIKYVNNFVDAIYWANIYPSSKIDIVQYMFTKRKEINEYRPDMLEENRHFFVCDELDWKRFPVNNTYLFDYELDWLANNQDIVKKFLEIADDRDNLTLRLKSAMEFFHKAITIEKAYKKEKCNITLESDVVLFIHTALECLILKNSDEDNKSLRIRKCVDRNMKGYNINENYNNMFDFIKYITNVRGSYVHQGSTYKEENRKDIFSDSDKGKLTDLEHLKIICAKIIMKSADIVYKIKSENISEQCSEKEYFVRLRGNY